MSLVMRLLPDNPVLIKEMRVRMRGARAYWILFGYLGFLSLVLLSQYWAFISQVDRNNGHGGSEAAQIGNSLFMAIVVTQMFLVLFITPAITSGSLTIEREQRTMDMLSLTRLARRSIISGKLLSAVSFTALLLISSLPLISICFMLGSVDPGMVVSTYLELLMGSVVIGAMGLMWSSIARTTTQAVMLTYATLFVMFAFGAFAFGMTAIGNMGIANGANAIVIALRAMGDTWFSDRFIGITGPNGLGFAILAALGGLLMAAVAKVRLEMFPERQAKLLRGITLLIVGVQLMAVYMWWLDAWYNRAAKAVMVVVTPPIGALVVPATLLLLLVPTFATGDLSSFEARRFGRYLLDGWTPKGLGRGKMASGLPFLALLTLFSLGLYVLSFALVGKLSDIGWNANKGSGNPASGATSAPAPFTPGVQVSTKTVNNQTVTTTVNGSQTTTVIIAPNGRTVTTTTVNGQVVSTTRGMAQKPGAKNQGTAEVGAFLQAALVLLVAVVGFALLCQFLSVAFRNRWVAWALASLFLLVFWITPELSRIDTYSNYSGNEPNILINLFYFNPAQTVLQMSDPVNYWSNRSLLFGDTPMWKVTTVVWLGIGGLSFLLMLPFVRREGRRSAVIPYEEMVANA